MQRPRPRPWRSPLNEQRLSLREHVPGVAVERDEGGNEESQAREKGRFSGGWLSPTQSGPLGNQPSQCFLQPQLQLTGVPQE